MSFCTRTKTSRYKTAVIFIISTITTATITVVNAQPRHQKPTNTIAKIQLDTPFQELGYTKHLELSNCEYPAQICFDAQHTPQNIHNQNGEL